MFESYNREATVFDRLWDQLEKFCGYVGDLIEAFYRSDLRVNLMEALAAGVCVGVILSLMTGSSTERLYLSDFIKVMVTTLSCYLVVALFLHHFWKGQLSRMVPTWILIPVLGAVLALSVSGLEGAIAGWSNPRRIETSLTEYVIATLKAWRGLLLFFTVVTLPITAMIHYAGTIVRGMRR